MSKSTWSQTKLYEALAHRNTPTADAMRNLTNRPSVMAAIELTLDLGGTTPKDFTLHDSDHSFRVAQRMWDLIPEKTRAILSDYELGMLLLCAYLHDIGMSPAFEKVQRHQLFLHGDPCLSPEEIADFQQWIDDDHRTSDLDIRRDRVTDPHLVNYILSNYIRYKHNDWSGEWIVEHLMSQPLRHYPQWTHDLILICKSHHYGLEHLLGPSFDPRPVESDVVVHRRYLAICLRVADVMENDPERTPEVLLNHRNIDPASLTYWLKDQQFRLMLKGNTFTIYARPKHAFIHKAIEETANMIEAELKLCAELIRRRPFPYSATLNLADYQWTIEPVVNRDIQPEGNAYEYIQGAFKPNTAKILELLGGRQLYGTAIAAFRELVSNSFDATKERLAYQIIRDDLDQRLQHTMLGELYPIDLTLMEKDDGYWLVCKDRGVGMTKHIIEKYFLQSGTSKRHEIRELERACRKRGFELARTGQFGIGALCYFMLAERIIIRTKRELNTGYRDEESISWRFEINGTHDFGELAREETPVHGTTIEFKLKPEITDRIKQWDQRFALFLTKDITMAPCRVNYVSCFGTDVKVGVGWTRDWDWIRHRLGRVSRGLGEEAREIADSLDFLYDEGTIDKFIRYKIYIPFFRLKKGNSLVYMKEKLEEGKHYITGIADDNDQFFWKADHDNIQLGLKGIRIGLGEDKFFFNYHPYANVELNFEHLEEHQLHVSRRWLQLDREYARYLTGKMGLFVRNLLRRNWAMFDNCYASVNACIARFPAENLYWAFADDRRNTKDMLWQEVRYPAVFYPDVKGRDRYLRCRIDGVDLPVVYGTIAGSKQPLDLTRHLKFEFRLGLEEGEAFQPVGIVLKTPTYKAKYDLHLIHLPAEWSKVLIMNLSGMSCLNQHHPLFPLYDPTIFLEAMDAKKNQWSAVLVDKRKCLGFLLYFLTTELHEWSNLCMKEPEVAQALFDVLGLDEIYYLSKIGLTIMSPDGWKLLGVKESRAYLPPITDRNAYFSAKNL